MVLDELEEKELNRVKLKCLKWERKFKKRYGRAPTSKDIIKDEKTLVRYTRHKYLKAKKEKDKKQTTGRGPKRRKLDRAGSFVVPSSIERPVQGDKPVDETLRKANANKWGNTLSSTSGRSNRKRSRQDLTRKHKARWPQSSSKPKDTPRAVAPSSEEPSTPASAPVLHRQRPLVSSTVHPTNREPYPVAQTHTQPEPDDDEMDEMFAREQENEDPQLRTPLAQVRGRALLTPGSVMSARATPGLKCTMVLKDTLAAVTGPPQTPETPEHMNDGMEPGYPPEAEQENEEPQQQEQQQVPLGAPKAAMPLVKDEAGFAIPPPRLPAAKRTKRKYPSKKTPSAKTGATAPPSTGSVTKKKKERSKSARKDARVSANFCRKERGRSGNSYTARRNRSKGQSRKKFKKRYDKFGNKHKNWDYMKQKKQEQAERTQETLYTDLIDVKVQKMGESDDDSDDMPIAPDGGANPLATPKPGPKGETVPATPLAPPTPYPPTPKCMVQTAQENMERMQVKDYTDFSDEQLEKKMREVLMNNFPFTNGKFREGQKQTIMQVLRGKKTLLILPTGGGKSLTFQVPAVMLGGLTLIVTPLISLMKDQCDHLPEGVNGAVWNSAHSREDNWETIQRLRGGHIQVLFVSPERLFSQGFQRVITRLEYTVSFACIDEAHCVSEWSHNFRPAYLRIKGVLEEVFQVERILGLTATATQLTRESIMTALGIPHENLVCIHRARNNLRLTVSREHNNMTALLGCITSPRFSKLKGGIIVYITYIYEAVSVAAQLKLRGLKVATYHGKMKTEDRVQVQQAFMENKIRVVVATIAFGMGLDKQDVCAVIHYNCPRTFEHYVQEVGRAGRNGAPAECHCFFREKHVTKMRSLVYSDGMDRMQIRDVLNSIWGSKTSPGQAGHFIGITRDKIGGRWDVSQAVVGTLISRLALDHQVVKIYPDMHNRVKIGFSDKDGPKKAAEHFPAFETMLGFCKPRNGYYCPQITRWANECQCDIVDIQRDIMELKRRRLITVWWERRSYAMKLLKSRDEIDLDDLNAKLSKYFQDTEDLALEKVNAMAQALKSVSCDTYKEANVNTESSEKLHKLQENYFKCQDSAEFLRHLDEMCDEADKMVIPHIAETHFMHKELISDIKAFVCQHKEVPARAISRIFHGMSSPQYSYKAYFQNPFWEKHVTFPFKQMLGIVRQQRAPMMSALYPKGSRRKIKEDFADMHGNDDGAAAAVPQVVTEQSAPAGSKPKKRKKRKAMTFLDCLEAKDD